MAKDYGDGVWRTINGRRVFIAEGQSLGDAMKKSGKFGKVSKVKGVRKNTFKDEISQGDKNRFAMGQGLSKEAVKGYAKARQDENKKSESRTYEQVNKEWKDQASKMEKNYKEFGGNTIEDEKKLNDLSKERDSLQYKKSPREVKEADERYNSPQGYSKDEQDILDRFSEDYGYDKGDNLKNLKGQIDYMRNPGDSIHRTAERLVEGGDFLIYNGDVKDYLDERGIKYNEDNFFDKYKKDMADKIERLYNSESLKKMSKEGSKELASNSGQERINNNVKVMRYGDDYVVLKNGHNEKEFKNQDDAESYAKTLTNNKTINDAIKEKASKSKWKPATTDEEIRNRYSEDMAYARGAVPHGSSDERLLRTFKRVDKIRAGHQQAGEEVWDWRNGKRVDDARNLPEDKESTNKIFNDAVRNRKVFNAYQKYIRKHPNSKIKYNEFKDLYQG